MITQGQTEIANVKINNDEITSIKIGEVEVFSSGMLQLLGPATSFDIASIYPKYAELTAENFYFLHLEGASGSSSINVNGYTQYLNISGELVRSYNASTGQLEMYQACNGNKGNVIIGMITDTSKLKYLGQGTSFNMSSYPNYKNFTLENFCIDPQSWWYIYRDSRSANGRYSASAGFGLTRSYNADTGVLSIYFNQWGSVNKEAPNPKVYFSEKPFKW